jgi:hypothetical protein
MPGRRFVNKYIFYFKSIKVTLQSQFDTYGNSK